MFANAQNAIQGLWIPETHQPGLWQRINGDNFCPVIFTLLQGCHHARCIGSGIMANHHNHLCLIKIVEFYCTFSDANGW
ncbi:hypothetical protein D3C87_1053480 [compost metagenome]